MQARSVAVILLDVLSAAGLEYRFVSGTVTVAVTVILALLSNPVGATVEETILKVFVPASYVIQADGGTMLYEYVIG